MSSTVGLKGTMQWLCIIYIAAAVMYLVNAYLKTDSIHYFVGYSNITVMLL
jgi:hypothetical protein